MTKQNHTTNVYAVFFLVIICLNAHVLQAQDFRPPARGLQVNQPLQLSKKLKQVQLQHNLLICQKSFQILG